MDANIILQKVQKTLSDGSVVFQVRLWYDAASFVEFSAVTEDESEKFMDSVSQAILSYTVDVARIEKEIVEELA